ncbi:hypothetical protein C8R43DRAFT_887267 [Mycena crocata]|nr:hypothetical protein C8R43DRAFT_887267 [Mycena crocata]
MTYSFFFLILPFLTVGRAANDWTKPCVSGVCSWDLPSTNGSTPSGSLKIWGSQTAISDITEAAGWKILGCDPDALTQDIRLVCMGGDMCQHLYEGHGAVDTIVRLPASCGKGPFARIAKTWVSQDQSLPASLAARIVRRTGADPQVQALTLDTNFAAADNAKTGAVNLAIMGANVPGINDILANDPSVTASQRRSRVNKRGLTNFVVKAAKSISDAVSGVNTVDINKSKALPAVDFSKKANLFSQSLSCPPITAKMSVDVDATAHAVVTLGVAASGTIVPPKSLTLLRTGLTADLNGELDLTADLSGSLSSPSIKLFEAGIPGLDFPGILSVGPTFVVTANAKATLDLNVDMKVGLNYHIDKAQLVFPPNGQKASGFSLGQTPLKLSADTKAAATGTVEGHIVPAINLGISALGVVDATVFLNLDASATMTLKVDAQAVYSDDAPTSASLDAPAAASEVAVSTDSSASFGGSFVISAGLDVNAGATGSFFGLFDKSTKVSLFKKNFELLRVRYSINCAGAPLTFVLYQLENLRSQQRYQARIFYASHSSCCASRITESGTLLPGQGKRACGSGRPVYRRQEVCKRLWFQFLADFSCSL